MYYLLLQTHSGLRGHIAWFHRCDPIRLTRGTNTRHPNPSRRTHTQPVTRALPSGEVPFLPGVYQGGPVGAVVLPLYPIHADPGVGDGPVRMLGRQVCSLQRLFEEFQLSHCHFTVFRYSALHVKDQVLTCGGVRVEEFSCRACVHWEKTDSLSLPSWWVKPPHFVHNYHHNTVLPRSHIQPLWQGQSLNTPFLMHTWISVLQMPWFFSYVWASATWRQWKEISCISCPQIEQTSLCASAGHQSRKPHCLQWKSVFICCPGCCVHLLKVEQDLKVLAQTPLCLYSRFPPLCFSQTKKKKDQGQRNILREVWFLLALTQYLQTLGFLLTFFFTMFFHLPKLLPGYQGFSIKLQQQPALWEDCGNPLGARSYKRVLIFKMPLHAPLLPVCGLGADPNLAPPVGLPLPGERGQLPLGAPSAAWAPDRAGRNVTCVARDAPEDAGQAGQSSALHPLALQHGDVFVLDVVWDNQIRQISVVKFRDLGEPHPLQQHLLEPFLGKRSGCGDQAEHAEHLGEPRVHPPPWAKQPLTRQRRRGDLGLLSAEMWWQAAWAGQSPPRRGFIASFVPLAQQIPQVGTKERT